MNKKDIRENYIKMLEDSALNANELEYTMRQEYNEVKKVFINSIIALIVIILVLISLLCHKIGVIRQYKSNIIQNIKQEII